MADFTSSSSSSDKPIFSKEVSSGAADDACEDFCSICLEPFSIEDPATVTNCKHEYHLQCILEWSQRSKECPICWQFLVLQDHTSQQLLGLAAGENERSSRSRNSSPTETTFLNHFQEDLSYDHDTSYSDDSDIDEHFMQQLVAAASRARYARRRERQRSSGLGPSEILVFHGQATDSGSSEGNSPTHSIRSAINAQPPSLEVPSAVNTVSSGAVDRNGSSKPRFLFGLPPPSNNQGRSSPSELLSFSDSIKSRLSAASARYKESISKSTRGFKEKLLSRNNSVKELGRGVQREMSAGMATVTRMMERLDPILKRTGACNPDSIFTEGTSSVAHKGKGVEENVIARCLPQFPSRKNGEIVDGSNLDASSLASDTTISGRVEVSPSKSRR